MFSYTVSRPDTVPPILVDLYTTEIGRTKARFAIIANEPIVLYYMHGLAGMVTPTADEI